MSPGLILPFKMPSTSRILAFKNAGRAGEFQDEIVHACRLHDAAVFRQIAVKAPAKPPSWLNACSFERMTPFSAVGVHLVEAPLLAEKPPASARRRERRNRICAPFRCLYRALHPNDQARLSERFAVHGRDAGGQQARIVELSENAHDAAGMMHVFHVNRRHGGRHPCTAPARGATDGLYPPW